MELTTFVSLRRRASAIKTERFESNVDMVRRCRVIESLTRDRYPRCHDCRSLLHERLLSPAFHTAEEHDVPVGKTTGQSTFLHGVGSYEPT